MLSLSKHLRWAGLLLLAGCAQPPAEPKAETIACAIDGAADFADVCTVERAIVPGGSIETVRHPDGGFRRFEIEGDWVRAADGADAATTAVRDGATEVTIDDDRYRFPPPPPPFDARRS